MDFEQVKTFIYVSITKSFRKAGEILYVSQPTVSARVRALERELGYKLFTRDGTEVTLTEEGRTLLPFAKKSIDNMDNGLFATHQINKRIKGELSISIVLTMSNYIFPILLEKFHKLFPDIKLTVFSGHSHNVLDMVLNYEAPLGIVRSVDHPRIETIDLIDDELVLAVHPNHPFTLRKVVLLEEIKGEPLILFNHGSIDWTLINNLFNKLNIEPYIKMQLDNIELVKQMIRKKVGIGILPKSSIDDELGAKSLKKIYIKNLPQLSRPFQLIHLKNTKISSTSKLFTDFITKEIKKADKT